MSQFESYYDFIDSDEYDEYSDRDDLSKYFELVDNNILTPKIAFEYYINESNSNISKQMIKKFIDKHKINIDDLYDLPTDSHEPINLLGLLCEHRQFQSIKDILELGANPNIIDKINYTPFQSLISGHSYDDIGKNSEGIKTTIELLLSYGANLVLEKWQLEELYKPYVQTDQYFEQLLSKIKITENLNE